MTDPRMLIKNAMLLRQKYRVPGNKVRLSPFLLGVHPQNRAGAHMSGTRALELFKHLLVKEVFHLPVGIVSQEVFEYQALEMLSGSDLLST